MKSFLLLIAAMIMGCISSCSNGSLPGPGNTSIVGKWRWVKSVGGIGGTTITPQNSGNNFRSEFYADSSFKRFKNDTLITASKFSIIRNYHYSATETVDVLKIESYASFLQAFQIRNDTLYTNDISITDGYGNAYVRIK